MDEIDGISELSGRLRGVIEEITTLLCCKETFGFCKPEDLKQWRKAVKEFSEALSGAQPSDRQRRRDNALAVNCIKLSESLESAIDEWILDSSSFFETSPNCEERLLQQPTFREFYRNAARNEAKRTITDIRRRFNLFVFFKALHEKGYHDGTRWYTHAKDQLVSEILRPDKRADIPNGHAQPKTEAEVETHETLCNLAEVGRGYWQWSQEFGHVSYLFLLPSHLTETLYVDRHHREDIPRIADHFRKLGIEDLASEKIRILGDDIVKGLTIQLLPDNPSKSHNDVKSTPAAERRKPKRRKLNIPGTFQFSITNYPTSSLEANQHGHITTPSHTNTISNNHEDHRRSHVSAINQAMQTPTTFGISSPAFTMGSPQQPTGNSAIGIPMEPIYDLDEIAADLPWEPTYDPTTTAADIPYEPIYDTMASAVVFPSMDHNFEHSNLGTTHTGRMYSGIFEELPSGLV